MRVGRVERALWHPVVPALVVGYFGICLVLYEVTPLRIFGVVWCAVWLAPSLWNRASGGALVRRFERRAPDDAGAAHDRER